MLLKGEGVKVEACHTEPGEIIWENQHITWRSRWLRLTIQLLLLIVLIALGFLIISGLNILSPSTSVDSINTTAITAAQIVT
jgi:hypothetical protein